ncbi:MAG TPA: hypothetical protein VIK54_13540 [Acidimicrobiia bacterium]
MFHFFAGCALGATVVICIGVPFLAPWPIRLRYLLTAQVADPVLGLGPTSRLSMWEVTLTVVEANRGHLDLVVDETGNGRSARRIALIRDGCVPSEVAKLDGWLATRTPLLMIVDEDGDTHLNGPDGVVAHLDRVGEKIR